MSAILDTNVANSMHEQTNTYIHLFIVLIYIYLQTFPNLVEMACNLKITESDHVTYVLHLSEIKDTTARIRGRRSDQ